MWTEISRMTKTEIKDTLARAEIQALARNKMERINKIERRT